MAVSEDRERVRTREARRRAHPAVLGLVALLALGACTPKPLVEFTTDVPPLVLTPIGQAGIADERSRFREILCAVNAAQGHALPDYRPCEAALARLSDEPPPSGRLVHLGPARSDLHLVTVPGYSGSCIEGWADTRNDVGIHIESLGWPITYLPVSAFSSSEHNAREIRDMLASATEVAERAAAVVSVAGAIGGSVLADDPPRSSSTCSRTPSETRRANAATAGASRA